MRNLPVIEKFRHQRTSRQDQQGTSDEDWGSVYVPLQVSPCMIAKMPSRTPKAVNPMTMRRW